ncbi:GTPase ObgE, partial [Candidatus Saccharibacteria bacterium]|nr:GTPase ObgE [Candidatus Saccharibacteria bacterium]
GGDGAVSFRHEIYVDKGGPDGGDGGKGGDVVFEATTNLNTLLHFRFKPELKAENGTAGGKRKMHGKSGSDLIVHVPLGTLVRRDGKVIADLTEEGQRAIVAHGGDGGFGNAHFKSSVRQTPRIAEKGEMGEMFEAELELKLLADVGLVGLPNAGKSTFLSVVTNAQPEIANYAFTTLTPNLGVATIDTYNLLIADIPGLIEGAAEGKGLGDQFLRHVERTAVLLHLIDSYSNDIAADYKTIRSELAKYSDSLTDRPEVVALTKTDGLDDEMVALQLAELRKVVPKNIDVVTISATAHKGLEELLRLLREKVEESRQKVDIEEVVEDEIPVISLGAKAVSDAWTIEKDEEVYVVRGEKIEKFARRTNFEQYQGVNRLRDIMKKLGIEHELIRQGAKGDSVIRIGAAELTLLEQDIDI